MPISIIFLWLRIEIFTICLYSYPAFASIRRPINSISFNRNFIKNFSVRVGILSCNWVSDIWFLISDFEVLMPMIVPRWISLLTICDAMIPSPTLCWIAEIIAWWLSMVRTDWRRMFDFWKWCLNQFLMRWLYCPSLVQLPALPAAGTLS